MADQSIIMSRYHGFEQRRLAFASTWVLAASRSSQNGKDPENAPIFVGRLGQKLTAGIPNAFELDHSALTATDARIMIRLPTISGTSYSSRNFQPDLTKLEHGMRGLWQVAVFAL